MNTAARLGKDRRFPISVSRSSLAATTAETGFAWFLNAGQWLTSTVPTDSSFIEKSLTKAPAGPL